MSLFLVLPKITLPKPNSRSKHESSFCSYTQAAGLRFKTERKFAKFLLGWSLAITSVSFTYPQGAFSDVPNLHHLSQMTVFHPQISKCNLAFYFTEIIRLHASLLTSPPELSDEYHPCLPCLPLFLPLSLFLSLPARVIVPLSIPVSLSGFPPASLCFFLPLSLFLSHCLPGSPSQHCSKLAPPPFSLLSVCQSLLLSHTHENG